MIKCYACQKELGKKEVLYTEDKNPYCINPFSCNHEEHPNSVKNIVARGGAIKLFTEEELEDNIFERLQITEEMKKRIIQIATKPQSIRLSKYEIAYYLIALQESKQLASISEAVRYCVTATMHAEPIDTNDIPDVPVQELESPDTIVVPDMPKSINVNWDDIVKEEENRDKDEEETFTF